MSCSNNFLMIYHGYSFGYHIYVIMTSLKKICKHMIYSWKKKLEHLQAHDLYICEPFTFFNSSYFYGRYRILSVMTKFDPFQSFYLISKGKIKKRWIGLNLRVMTTITVNTSHAPNNHK